MNHKGDRQGIGEPTHTEAQVDEEDTKAMKEDLPRETHTTEDGEKNAKIQNAMRPTGKEGSNTKSSTSRHSQSKKKERELAKNTHSH